MSDEELFAMQVRDKDSGSFNSHLNPRSSWSQRTFGPMKAGSVRGSIFTLASTAMGAGYLATPTILELTGVFLGLFIIVVGGLITTAGLQVVSKCAEKHKIFHYPKVAKEMLGNKWAVLLEIAIISNGYGLILALNIVVGSLIPSIMSSFGIHGHDELERALAMVALNVCIITPLGIMRNLGALRFKALFNVTCLTFIMLVIIIEFPFFVEDNNYSDTNYFTIDINFPAAFSLSLFAYLCHQNLTRIQNELNDRTLVRMNKVIRRSVSIMYTLFSTLALFGYLSCLKKTPHLIIMRKAPSSIDNDWAMVVCRVMITFTMSIAIPININPCRVSIQRLFFNTEDKASNLMHYGITFFIIFSTLLIAIFFPNIEIVFHFLGGFCGSVMALIIPGLMYVKSTDLPISHWKNIMVLVGSFGLALLGFTSLAIDFYKLAK